MTSNEGETHWWWTNIWKLQSLKKTKLLMWLALMDKIPTWEFSQKKNKQGLGICYLYRNVEEIVSHIFTRCLFSLQIWIDIY
jgi:hypothetical protein